jgi:peptide/nickel transport system permease protein
MSEEIKNTALIESAQSSLFKQLQKRRWTRLALNALLTLIVIALLAPLLANERPLYLKYKGEVFFPAFWDVNPFADKNFYEINSKYSASEKLQLDITDWKNLDYEQAIWCIVPYSPGKSDYRNANFVSPFENQNVNPHSTISGRFRHLLGTGVRGEDVLAGLIHGTRISLSVGMLAMLLASCLGLFLGAIAGYFGDYEFKMSRAVFVSTLIGLALGFYYAFYFRSFSLKDAFAISSEEGFFQFVISLIYLGVITLVAYKSGRWLETKGLATKLIFIPLDSIISRTLEIIISLPTFILILSLAAITKASILNLIVLIALTSWTGIARLTRAEILRIKKLDYIQAAKALGYSQSRIIIRHALLNGLAPALVAIAFGVASTILIESSLSFLGIGLPIDTVTWGSMLSEGRTQFSAWWMTLFPGLAIFITLTIYNILGDALREIR